MQLFDDPAWVHDLELPDALAGCFVRGAKAYICASGRGRKCISQHRTAIDLIDGQTQAFTCALEVPPQAVTLSVGVGMHGPIRAVISDLSFSVDEPAKLRLGQGPKNLELIPDPVLPTGESAG